PRGGRMDKLCSSLAIVALVSAAFGCSKASMSQPATPAAESPPSSLSTNWETPDSTMENENRGVGGGPASAEDTDDPMKPTPDKGGNWDQSGFGNGTGNGSGKTGASPSGSGGPDDITPNGTTPGGMKTDDPWMYQKKSEQTKKKPKK